MHEQQVAGSARKLTLQQQAANMCHAGRHCNALPHPMGLPLHAQLLECWQLCVAQAATKLCQALTVLLMLLVQQWTHPAKDDVANVHLDNGTRKGALQDTLHGTRVIDVHELDLLQNET
jgi:hypothetical protein